MLIRYGKNNKNKTVRVARIYTRHEHNLDKNLIDKDALHIIQRLNYFSYQAYIVGGAVRDLLLGKIPKDFDIVTDAPPGKIRRIFRNSRIIGRRFKLVHIYYGRNKNIEVSTFRSGESGPGENYYGTIDEDARRRDITINALYYCPKSEQLIDYVDGYSDLMTGKISCLTPTDKSFLEDPVRMIRIIKYASDLDFKINSQIKKSIKKNAHLLNDCSKSRLTEEIFKILKSGSARKIFYYLIDFDLFRYIQPRYFSLMQNKKNYNAFILDMEKLDESISLWNESRAKEKAIALYARQALKDYFDYSKDNIHKQFFLKIKDIFYPLTPPNADVDGAVKIIMQEKGLGHSRAHYQKRKAVFG